MQLPCRNPENTRLLAFDIPGWPVATDSSESEAEASVAESPQNSVGISGTRTTLGRQTHREIGRGSLLAVIDRGDASKYGIMRAKPVLRNFAW